jgi:hypothetical protein
MALATLLAFAPSAFAVGAGGHARNAGVGILNQAPAATLILAAGPGNNIPPSNGDGNDSCGTGGGNGNGGGWNGGGWGGGGWGGGGWGGGGGNGGCAGAIGFKLRQRPLTQAVN